MSQKKILIAVLGVIVVAGLLFAGNSSLFQGKLKKDSNSKTNECYQIETEAGKFIEKADFDKKDIENMKKILEKLTKAHCKTEVIGKLNGKIEDAVKKLEALLSVPSAVTLDENSYAPGETVYVTVYGSDGVTPITISNDKYYMASARLAGRPFAHTNVGEHLQMIAQNADKTYSFVVPEVAGDYYIQLWKKDADNGNSMMFHTDYTVE